MEGPLRLFVALDPSPEARAELAALVAPARERFDARWTAPDKWHLTLAFLGETPEEALPGVKAAVDAAAAACPPLRLWVEGAGTFGGRRPRVLWLGLAGDTAPCEELSLALHAAVLEAERGGLHLTVARARRDARALLRAAHALEGARSSAFEVRELTLYESRGGAYAPLHRARLGSI